MPRGLAGRSLAYLLRPSGMKYLITKVTNILGAGDRRTSTKGRAKQIVVVKQPRMHIDGHASPQSNDMEHTRCVYAIGR